MSRLEEFDDVQLDVEFTQADSRSNLTSNENIAISFGKLSKWYEALVPTGGSSGQFLAWNSSGTAKWVSNPNVDTKVTSTLLAQSTAAATYLPTFVSAAGNSGVNIMNSFSFGHTVGTTSVVGNSRIVLGNATASGTANNEEGQIVLYSSSTSYHTIKGSATSSTVTHSLPTTGGTILNTGTTSFTRTLTSGTKIGSIKINGTSQDIYAPTNTNTTYSLTQDSTDGHKITLTPSSGTAQTITIPDNNTTYSAGTGLSLSGTTFNHSNSVTAVTSAVFKKITYDAQGHITGTANVTASDLPSHTHNYLPFEKITTAADADTYTANTGWYNWNTTSGTHMPTTNYGILLSKEYPSVQMFLPDTGTAIYLRKKTNASTAGTSWMGITGTAGSTYNLANFYNTTTSRTANTVLAAPNGSDGAATFRELVASDIPSLDYSKVSISRNLTSGTKVGTITIDGTATDLYCQTNTNTTYTLSGAYGSSSNTWVTTLTPSSGTATTSTVPTASTSVYGITKLSSSTSSTSTALAATSSAVKSAYDLANGKSTVSFSASLTTGTKVGTITIDGTATDIYCETNTNTDTKVTDTVGTANTYYPAGGTSTSTSTGTQVFDTSLKYIGTTGTTSAVGKAQLVLGNSTASGTANNKQGSIVVYGSTAYAHTIQGAPTAARTLTLPDKTGTLATTSDLRSAGTGLSLSGTTINHANSVTAVTNYNKPYVKYDAQGHITGSSYWTATAGGANGESGWIKIATMVHTGNYDNTPIMLLVSQRGNTIAYKIHIVWKNAGNTDPDLDKFQLSSDISTNVSAYIKKSATSTWELYIKKLDNYEAIAMHLYAGRYFSDHMTWTWQDVQTAASAITGGTEASKIVPFNFYTSRTANTVLAAPNGSDGAATFRELVAADLAGINYAGSSSAGGPATSANKLNTDAGTTQNPVYFSDGIPVACKQTTNKSWYGVPAVRNDGVMEIGRYIDFHMSNYTDGDFSLRLDCTNSLTATRTVTFPDASGTIALTSSNITGTSSNVTGTVAIAHGGTGATTRLNALKALTDEKVGTDAQYFLTITQSWGKGGYTTVADAKTVLGLGSAAYTESSEYSLSTHAHGNITSAGALQTTDITIASGDKLVVTDSSNSNKVARTSIAFDGSTATKCLTQKGTWESFTNNAGTVTGSSLTANNIILGNGSSAIKSSGKTITTSITDVDTTVPTSKAVSTFVRSLTYFYPVKGTQTSSTSAWKGAIDVAALYDGLTIAYYLPYASTSTAVTLNLTLSDGTTTGAINCYYTNSNRITTHYGLGATVVLTYWSGSTIGTGDNRWTRADYDSNSNNAVTQNLLSTDTNRPLMMSYYTTGSTTTSSQVLYRNDSIYANPSTGVVTANGFVGNLTGDVTGNASSSTKIYSELSDGRHLNKPIPFYQDSSAPSGYHELYHHNDFKVSISAGSTNTNATINLIIGNATASGTAGAKQGLVQLYGSGTLYGLIAGPPSGTTGKTINHPGAAGTIMLREDMFVEVTATKTYTDGVCTINTGLDTASKYRMFLIEWSTGIESLTWHPVKGTTVTAGIIPYTTGGYTKHYTVTATITASSSGGVITLKAYNQSGTQISLTATGEVVPSNIYTFTKA